MKFAVAVVMLALAVGVQSSLLAAHVAPGVSYVTQTLHPQGAWGAWGGPWGHGPAAVAVDHSLGYGGWGAGAWGHGGWGIPGISLSQGPGYAGHAGHAAVVAAPLAYGHGHGHEGVYVAKTRGAVHTAPLAGHINSATSINVAPAPGTH